MCNQFSSSKTKVPCEKVMTLATFTAAYSLEGHKGKHKNGH